MSAGDATARLHEAIDLVAGIDASELPTPEVLGGLLEELTRCTRRLEFEFHRLLRTFEARGDHEPLGYRTAKQWCRDRLRMSDGAAATSLKVGRVLVEMPGTAARWASGDVGAEHAAAIASVRTDGTREVFGEWEGWLAQQAVDLDMRGLRKVLQRWRLQVDPRCDDPERIERDRDAHVSATFQGAVVIDGVLEAIGGAAFKTVFDGLVEELFKADWAEAKERLGREPLSSELARTPAQRRADALVLMAAARPAAGAGPGPRALRVRAGRGPDRVQRAAPVLHRQAPEGHPGPRPPLHRPRLRPARRVLRRRPHRPLRRRGTHPTRQRAGRLQPRQPSPTQTALPRRPRPVGGTGGYSSSR